MAMRARPHEWDGEATRHRNFPVLDNIERFLDDRTDIDSAWVSRLNEHLRELHAALVAHHAAEEHSALYTSVPQRHPVLSRRLFRLVAEHDALVATTDELVRASHRAATGPDGVRVLNTRSRLLVARIQRHEAEEHELMMEALVDDLEASD